MGDMGEFSRLLNIEGEGTCMFCLLCQKYMYKHLCISRRAA